MNKGKRLFAVILCVLIALAVSPAFQISDTSGAQMTLGVVQAQAASKITLSKTNIYVVKGCTRKLKVNGTSKKVKWTTSNKKIATVSSKGVVTAKAKGKATVTAKVAGKKLKCTVNVETPKISAKSATITILKSKTLKISGTKQKVTWKSGNTKIATVNKSGKVTAKKLGTVTITATVGSSKKYTCKVTVKDTKKGANFTKLENYINKYGKTGQNGDRYISTNYSSTDELGYACNYFTQIEFLNGEIWLCTLIEHENDTDAYIAFNINRYDDVSYTHFDYDDEGYFAFFRTSKYNNTYLDYQSQDYYDSIDIELNDWINSCLWLCMEESNYLLHNCGLSLEDLGLTNYEG